MTTRLTEEPAIASSPAAADDEITVPEARPARLRDVTCAAVMVARASASLRLVRGGNPTSSDPV